MSEPFIDVAISYALAYKEDVLRDAIRRIAYNVDFRHPGEYDPPEWMSFVGLSDDYDRTQSMYDMVLGYVTDYRYPLNDDVAKSKTCRDLIPGLEKNLCDYFQSFRLLKPVDQYDVLLGLVLYEAVTIIINKAKRQGVHKNYSPMNKIFGGGAASPPIPQ